MIDSTYNLLQIQSAFGEVDESYKQNQRHQPTQFQFGTDLVPLGLGLYVNIIEYLCFHFVLVTFPSHLPLAKVVVYRCFLSTDSFSLPSKVG